MALSDKCAKELKIIEAVARIEASKKIQDTMCLWFQIGAAFFMLSVVVTWFNHDAWYLTVMTGALDALLFKRLDKISSFLHPQKGETPWYVAIIKAAKGSP